VGIFSHTCTCTPQKPIPGYRYGFLMGAQSHIPTCTREKTCEKPTGYPYLCRTLSAPAKTCHMYLPHDIFNCFSSFCDCNPWVFLAIPVPVPLKNPYPGTGTGFWWVHNLIPLPIPVKKPVRNPRVTRTCAEHYLHLQKPVTCTCHMIYSTFFQRFVTDQFHFF
jgi:hypothetical protein